MGDSRLSSAIEQRKTIIDSYIVATSFFINMSFIIWFFPMPAMLLNFIAYIILFYHRRNLSLSEFFPCIILCFIYLVFAVTMSKSIVGFFNVFGVFFLFITNLDFIKEIYNKFVYIFAVCMGISVVMYVIVVLLEINLPHIFLDNISNEKTFDIYPFLCVTYNAAGHFTDRFSGLFDEPGVVGTFCGSILMINKFNLKNFFNVLVLVAGLFSMSLAFFIMCGAFILLYANIKYKIIASAVVFAVFVYLGDNDYFIRHFFTRIDSDSGGIQSTRVSSSFDMWYNSFIHTSSFWFGSGFGTAATIDPSGASYKHLIADYGIILFVLYIISYFFLIVKHLRIVDFLLALVLFWMVLYQRPFVQLAPYVLMFVSSWSILRKTNVKRKEQKVIIEN